MRLLVLCIALGATACSTTRTSQSTDGGTSSAGDVRLARAATSPLSDLNLMRQDLPAALASAQVRPYASPTDPSCVALGAEIKALDAALGPDLDAVTETTGFGLADQGAQVVGDAAIDAVRGAAEGVLPFRGWLRKLTGAERRDREQAAAIAAGTIRRAYLKGMGEAHGCEPPAAPQHRATVPVPKGEVKTEGASPRQ